MNRVDVFGLEWAKDRDERRMFTNSGRVKVKRAATTRKGCDRSESKLVCIVLPESAGTPELTLLIRCPVWPRTSGQMFKTIGLEHPASRTPRL